MSMGEQLDLPPGFRFHPTDEEIITYYLIPKVLNRSFSARAMGEVDLNKSEPWDLPSKAKMGEKEWYFYCQKDRKYPTGMRTNRATEAGYWKATGKDKEIYRGRGILVGMKKTLVFYKGRAPRGEKTNWVMHECRLEGRLPYPNNSFRSSKDEWVVCKVFHKSTGIKKAAIPMAVGGGLESAISMPTAEDFLVDSTALPPLMDPSSYYATTGASTSAAASAPLPASSYLNPSLVGAISNPPQLHMNQFSNPAATVTAAQQPMFYPQRGASMGGFMAAPASGQSSMVSQDTGLSTEHNITAEISSVVSASAAMDLDGMWKY